MYRNKVTSEQTYSLKEAAQLLGLSVHEVKNLVKCGDLGFEVSRYGQVVTNSHLSMYLTDKTHRGNPVWSD